MNKNFLLLLFCLLGLMGCQRDDICPESTATTPLLIIRFYENVEPFEATAPQNLSIREEGNEEYATVRNQTGNVIRYFRYTQDSLAIPLRTDNDVTDYEFTVNTPQASEEEPVDPGNTDILRFSYGRQEEYINRACAYKVNYVGLKVELEEGEDGNWIEEIQIENANIDDQNQAHVSIFF
ncbi:DUF6452 family protein [Gramella sp. GC03-9]|uniref:DUF6452 family protein n=1 Tax=Christiangramia oceanisediminis TaxID=2920386 RepID=A0A9X2KYX9_9FLAO|nr:DUF6452 family protein [Gramella oceanisediminis]MCP9200766.1 DUF6452 family protein [Gramella oceanisediminis]